jgi:hypothetical protein
MPFRTCPYPSLSTQGRIMAKGLRYVVECYILFDKDGSGTIDREEVLALIAEKAKGGRCLLLLLAMLLLLLLRFLAVGVGNWHAFGWRPLRARTCVVPHQDVVARALLPSTLISRVWCRWCACAVCGVCGGLGATDGKNGLLSEDRWKELDWDNDGCITFKEFIAAMYEWVDAGSIDD